MNELHIDDFYKDCAVILLRLYRTFPKKTSIYTGDLCGFEETDEIGQYSSRFQACFATLVWLEEEDYIKHQGIIGQEAIELATLTQKSFTALSGSPFSLGDSDKTNSNNRAQQLHYFINNGSSTQINNLISQLMAILNH